MNPITSQTELAPNNKKRPGANFGMVILKV